MTDTPHRGQRIVHRRFGDPNSVLEVEDAIFDRPLNPGEVLVRVACTCIHPGDLQLVAARYGDPSEALAEPRVPGFEAAGVIADCAADALVGTGLAIGSRVAFFAPDAWQSYVAVPVQALVGLPDDVPDAIAAQLLVNVITARHVLRIGLRDLSPRPTCLIQSGAASAVARIITILALEQGLEPVRLVRSAESARRLWSTLPGGTVISTDADDWQEAAVAAIDNRVALAVDGVGGPMLAELVALLAPRGRIVTYGILADAPSDLTGFSFKALTMLGASILTWAQDTSDDDRAADLAAAIAIAQTHQPAFAHHTTFALSQLDAAIAAATAPTKAGNVLLTF